MENWERRRRFEAHHNIRHANPPSSSPFACSPSTASPSTPRTPATLSRACSLTAALQRCRPPSASAHVLVGSSTPSQSFHCARNYRQSVGDGSRSSETQRAAVDCEAGARAASRRSYLGHRAHVPYVASTSVPFFDRSGSVHAARSKQQGRRLPDRSFEIPTWMRRLRVSGFLVALIQRTHSQRAIGVMSSHNSEISGASARAV